MKKALFFLILGLANLVFGGFYRIPVAVIFAFICVGAFILFSCFNISESDRKEENKTEKEKAKY